MSLGVRRLEFAGATGAEPPTLCGAVREITEKCEFYRTGGSASSAQWKLLGSGVFHPGAEWKVKMSVWWQRKCRTMCAMGTSPCFQSKTF